MSRQDPANDPRSSRRWSANTMPSDGEHLPLYSPLDTLSFPRRRFSLDRGPSAAGGTPSLRSTPSYSTLVPSGHSSSDAASVRTLVAAVDDPRRAPPGLTTEHPQYNLPDSDARHTALPQQFPFSFVVGGGRNPWATLQIRDERPIRADHQPGGAAVLKVAGGESLQGVLELKLENSMSILSIKLILKGRVITGYLADSGSTLIDHTVTLWDRSQGDPRDPKPGVPFNGRLSPGLYQFPFTFPFQPHVHTSTLKSVDMTAGVPEVPEGAVTPFIQSPSPTTPRRRSFFRRSMDRNAAPLSVAQSAAERPTSIHIPGKTSDDVRPDYDQRLAPTHPDVSPLPSTLLEKTVRANTMYELSLVINHGGLRGDSKVKVPIVYTGSSEYPPPTSERRQRAHMSGTPVPGPLEDPEGWCTLPTIQIAGTLSRQRRVDAEYTLSLSRPLSYTRGTGILCHLIIRCPDTTALEHISVPNIQRVRLTRTVRYNMPRENVSAFESEYRGVTPLRTTQGATSSGQDPSRSRTASGNRRASTSSTITPFAVDSDVGVELDEYKWNMQDRTTVAIAVWRSFVDSAPISNDCRTLKGVIHLPDDLHPSCPHPSFHISYTVELLSFHSSLFEPDRSTAPAGRGSRVAMGGDQESSLDKVYQRQVVDIVTKARVNAPPLATPSSSSPSGSHFRREKRVT